MNDTIIERRYKLLGRIGTGGMSSVYRACQLNVGRDVAVKILNSLYLGDDRAIQRFETEAQIISKLRHPNTVKLIDYGRLEDGRPFLVTELLLGETLDRRLGAPCDPEWTLKIMRQICDSLAEAHDLRIVHRDLKPANIFLERVGQEEIVRVLDFGIAKLEHSEAPREGESIFGTPAFMSPEQACGGAVDGRSDLYALGVIAYYALTGELPFCADSTPALLMSHLTEPVPSFKAVAPNVDVEPALEGLVMQLLEKQPRDRPRSARHVRDEIDRILYRTAIAQEARGAGRPVPNERRQHRSLGSVRSRRTISGGRPPARSFPDRRIVSRSRLGTLGKIAVPLFVSAFIAGAGGWLLGGRAEADPRPEGLTASDVRAIAEQRREPEAVLPASALPAPAKAPRANVPAGFVDFQLPAMK